MDSKLKVSIVGASGYGGGELIRLLLNHPYVELNQITSESNVGKYAHSIHPNLRGQKLLQFVSVGDLESCDVLFLAMPHGKAQSFIEKYSKLADKIIDLSADFRFSSKEDYKKWYGEEHLAPEFLSKFVYGLPEIHREEIKKAKYVSGVGCNATSVNIPLYPLAKEGLIDMLVLDLKVSSSEAGNKASEASHHPERANCLRTFAPVFHRHCGEISKELGISSDKIHFTATALDMVRGILSTSHVFLNKDVSEKDIRAIYRKYYSNEPFVRIVKDNQGIYRLPEPKILAGTNYCDIGFEKENETNRLVVIGAIDNLMKGASGTAVQCMNLMCGFEEKTALGFIGLHPI
ncbi:MAG TPA: N-acetyl-gamma-glutamyl-phosphate reductase [Rickettsiales bacterium]|nr:N-acetyl-gamma-glutamyl-phosphate reductase [Rickettsiales bacterium]